MLRRDLPIPVQHKRPHSRSSRWHENIAGESISTAISFPTIYGRVSWLVAREF